MSDLTAASDALSALTCPYYRGEGSCESGCHQEPSCQVDAPMDGWEAQLFKAAVSIIWRRNINLVALDDDLIANLDARAERHNTDRAGYLRWLLTGKAPEETPAKPRRKKP